MEQPRSENPENQNLIKKIVNLRPLDPIPEVEWWDAFFLPENEQNPKKKFDYSVAD